MYSAQTELPKSSHPINENEITALKTKIANQELELSRLLAVYAGNSAVFRDLLNQLYSLPIDPSLKRHMTDTCLRMIEIEVIEKRMNTGLTETDSIFISKLQKKHANLDPRELLICLFVKLNYDSKEIARAIKISSRSLESIRHRMHKKLGLEKHQSIKTYLLELTVTY
jgi:DNA-binding CsgD family transcriptional regulator